MNVYWLCRRRVVYLISYLKRIKRSCSRFEFRFQHSSMMVDSSLIHHEVIIDLKWHRKRTILHQSLLHSILRASTIVSSNIVVTRAVVFSAMFSWAGSILANIRITSFLHNSIILGISSCNQIGESSFTSLRQGRARYNVLGGEHMSPGVVGHDVHPGLQHAHAGECIAASASPLVPDIRDIVDSIHIPPVPGWRKVTLVLLGSFVTSHQFVLNISSMMRLGVKHRSNQEYIQDVNQKWR